MKRLDAILYAIIGFLIFVVIIMSIVLNAMNKRIDLLKSEGYADKAKSDVYRAQALQWQQKASEIDYELIQTKRKNLELTLAYDSLSKKVKKTRYGQNNSTHNIHHWANALDSSAVLSEFTKLVRNNNN
jgi:predicted Holliday junction resolvase-like endonuclease